MRQSIERKDIRSEPTEKKEGFYRLIDDLVKLFGFPVEVKEDKSGFPAIAVDCGGVHILTDIITLEHWQLKQKKSKEQETEAAREIRVELDNLQAWLRQLGLLEKDEYVYGAHIEPGELIIHIEREETNESKSEI